MRWADVPTNPSPKTLRQFAGLCTLFLGGLSAWLGPERPALSWGCLVLALTLGPTGLLWPSVVRPIFVAWVVLFFPVGWAVSQLLLALLLFGVFTPLSLFFRLVGRDALERHWEPDCDSYWTTKTSPADIRRYFRQY